MSTSLSVFCVPHRNNAAWDVLHKKRNVNERRRKHRWIKTLFLRHQTDEIEYPWFYWRLSIVAWAFISRVSYFPMFDNCSSTLRDFFLLARGWPYLLIMLMRKRSDRLAKTSEWGPNFPWTARLIICPWDTRSIMATGIASYPFYAKWERANGWPFGNRVTIRFRTTAPEHTGHFPRSFSYPQSFLRASHIGWPSKSRVEQHVRAVRSALPRSWSTIVEEVQYISFNTLFYSYDSRSVFLLRLLRIWLL